jgi:hypothetical protein
VFADLVPDHGIAFQDAQGSIIAADADGDMVADLLEAQIRQRGVSVPV